MQIDLEQLRELMQAVNEFEISELEIEQEGKRVLLRRGGHVVAAAPQHVVAAAHAPAAHAAHAPAAAGPAPTADDPNVAYITSPFVGTFYQSPSPDAPAFVRVGQNIKAGTVLCIVEAMKLMNEIESEIEGEILEILAENGKPVEFGDQLFKVRKA